MSQIALKQAFSSHPRQWRNNCYVYPVISRRSHGLSIGLNLSPGKACNFDCAYCCVDRSELGARDVINLVKMRVELDEMLALVASGAIWNEPEFSQIPDEYRLLADIALSGNGEPTLNPRLAECCKIAAHAKRLHRFFRARLVLITNGSLLRRLHVQSALTILDANQGDLWVKLDAGTSGYFKQINRCNTPFEDIVQNILETGRDRQIIVQSMFAKLGGQAMPAREFAAYCCLLLDLVRSGCRIKQVQIYTIARDPARGGAEAMSPEALEWMANKLRGILPSVSVDVFHGQ